MFKGIIMVRRHLLATDPGGSTAEILILQLLVDWKFGECGGVPLSELIKTEG
jgi:hypothetical protein